MSVSPCPSCREEVSLPDASPNATVRCPLCQDEYQFAQILDGRPPALVVLNDPNPVSSGNGSSGGVSATDSGGQPFAFDSHDSSPSESSFGDAGAPAFQFEQGTAPAATDGDPTPANRTPQPRRQKRQKNPMVEIVKVVLGGVIGLGGALVLLWWLPWGFDKDPFKMGPSISKYVPFIVPEKYRDPSVSNGDGGGEGDVNLSTDGKGIDLNTQQGQTSTDKGKNDSVAMTDEVPWESDSGVAQDQDSSSNVDDADDASVSDDTSGDDIVDDGSTSSSDTADDSSTSVTTNNTDNSFTPTTSTAKVTFSNPPFVATSDFINALEEVKSAGIDWANPDGVDAPKETIDLHFYKTLARLGEVITHIDSEDPEVQENSGRMDGMLTNFGKSADGYSFVGNRAAIWLNTPVDNRSNRGVIITGKVIGASQSQESNRVEIQSSSAQADKVTVLCLEQTASKLKQGSRVLILGVSAKPTEDLEGYEGSEPEIICCSRVILLDGTTKQTETKSTEPKPANPVDLPTIPVPNLDLPPIKVPSLPSTSNE